MLFTQKLTLAIVQFCMTKEDYINYWKETSEQDWSSAEDLFKTKHYLQSLFFAHLTIEKICKALWIADNETNHPPRIHNLVYLLKQTRIILPEEKLDFLLLLNDFQLEGRYPDYQQKIYKSLSEAKAKEILLQTNETRKWLLNNLP